MKSSRKPWLKSLGLLLFSIIFFAFNCYTGETFRWGILTTSTTTSSVTTRTTTITSTTQTQTSTTLSTTTSTVTTTRTTTTATTQSTTTVSTLTTTTNTATTTTQTTVTTRTTTTLTITTSTQTTRTTTTRTTTTLTTTTRTTTTLTTTTRTTTTRTTTTRTSTSTTTTVPPACPSDPAPGFVRIHMDVNRFTGHAQCSNPFNPGSNFLGNGGKWPSKYPIATFTGSDAQDSDVTGWNRELGPTCSWYYRDFPAGTTVKVVPRMNQTTWNAHVAILPDCNYSGTGSCTPGVFAQYNADTSNQQCTPQHDPNPKWQVALPASGHVYLRKSGSQTVSHWNYTNGEARINYTGPVAGDPASPTCDLCDVVTTTTNCPEYTYISWYESGTSTENIAGTGPKGGPVEAENASSNCASGPTGITDRVVGSGAFAIDGFSSFRWATQSGFRCFSQTAFWAYPDKTSQVDMSALDGGFIEIRLKRESNTANYQNGFVIGLDSVGSNMVIDPKGYDNKDARYESWVKPALGAWETWRIPLVHQGVNLYSLNDGSRIGFEQTGFNYTSGGANISKGLAITQAWGNNTLTTTAGVLKKLTGIVIWLKGESQDPDPWNTGMDRMNIDTYGLSLAVDYIRFAYSGCGAVPTTVPGASTTTTVPLECANTFRWMYEGNTPISTYFSNSYGGPGAPEIQLTAGQVSLTQTDKFESNSSARFQVNVTPASEYTYAGIPTRTTSPGIPPFNITDADTYKNLTGLTHLCMYLKDVSGTRNFRVILKGDFGGAITESSAVPYSLFTPVAGTLSGGWQRYCTPMTNFGMAGYDKVNYVQFDWFGMTYNGTFLVDNLGFTSTPNKTTCP